MNAGTSQSSTGTQNTHRFLQIGALLTAAYLLSGGLCAGPASRWSGGQPSSLVRSSAFNKTAGRSAECSCVNCISVAIATYKRVRYLKESVVVYASEPLIDEIVISDDAGSSDADELRSWLPESGLTKAQRAKVKLFPSETKLGALKNKARAIGLTSSCWAALMDSDNLANKDYWAALLEAWRADAKAFESHRHIYAPERCIGTAFDFKPNREAHGDVTRETWNDHLDFKAGNAMLNTGNYIAPRAILQAWEPLAAAGPEAYGQDTMVMNLAAIKAGFSMRIVEGMSYQHRLTEDSLWASTAQQSMNYLKEHAMDLRITD